MEALGTWGNIEMSDVGDPMIRWFNEGLERFFRVRFFSWEKLR